MRRIKLAMLGVLAIVITGGVALIATPQITRSGSDRSIPVYIASTLNKNGECVAPKRTEYPTGIGTPHVVIVENADGKIVATRILDKFDESEFERMGDTGCIALIFIPVPESDFYRVLVDDNFVTVVRESDLPYETDDPNQMDNRIPWLELDSDR